MWLEKGEKKGELNQSINHMFPAHPRIVHALLSSSVTKLTELQSVVDALASNKNRNEAEMPKSNK